MSIFSNFNDPIVLLGLMLILGFLLFKYLIKHNFIELSSVKFNTSAGKLLLKYGYVLGLVLMLIGLGLNHNKSNQAGQAYALNELSAEYNDNLLTVKQLLANTTETLQAINLVDDFLSSTDSKILSILFPQLNEREKQNIDINEQVNTSFERLKSLKLLNNESQITTFNAEKNDLKIQINKQLRSLSVRQDKDNELYVIKDQVWQNYQELIKETNDFNVPVYEKSLQQMKILLNQYRTTLKQAEIFFIESNDFTQRNTFLSNVDVYEILIKKNKAVTALTEFTKTLQRGLVLIENSGQVF